MAKPKPNPARLLSYELIAQVNQEGAYANIRLPELLGKTNLNAIDKAFATELSYGTLRMQGRHDYMAAKYLDRPIGEIDVKILNLLRIGIHQLTQMRVPDHAAVSETVEVAKLVAGESKASYVNAVLRKIASADTSLSELSDTPILERFSIEYSHPQWIISAFYDQLQDWDQVKELLIANNLPATPDVVAWPGKSSVEELCGLGAVKIEQYVNGVNLTGIPSEFDPIIQRRAGVQDRGSQAVVENFVATYQPNLSWLDMCAGPGGKAAYLFNWLEQREPGAIFIANEPVPHRAELVKRVVNNEQVITVDATTPTNFIRKWDRILIDAPCTGLGALRRRPESRWRKSLGDLKNLVVLQRELLNTAYNILEDRGIIAYVTCSPHIAETKAQVIDFLAKHQDMKILPIQSLSGTHSTGVLPDGSVQLWTHRDQSDAMFMVFFQKIDLIPS